MSKRVFVVPHDFTFTADNALDHAIKLSKQINAQIALVHIVAKENEIEPDFVSALKLCKRRRIGPLRPEANRELFYKKDMGILARGGFSFDLSKRVLNLDAKEFKKLLTIA